MRTSILSRSVIAVATLGIGSVALAAAPAMADTPSGITRAEVLTAAAVVRDGGNSTSVRPLIVKACGLLENDGLDLDYAAVRNPSGVDGLVVNAVIYEGGSGPSRYCTFAAFASTASGAQLSGTATIEQEDFTPGLDAAAVLQTSTLSGDVFVTAPYTGEVFGNVYASAGGNATTTTTSTTTSTSSTPKTSRQKSAAKKAYAKKLSAAKKSYKKALDKAGSSKSKKAAAKKSYAKKRASAKASYKKAISPTIRTSVTTAPVAANVPFNVTTKYNFIDKS